MQKKHKRLHGHAKSIAENVKVPLEHGNGSVAESLLFHLAEGCLTDRWRADKKVSSGKRLEHLKRVCDWIYRMRGQLPPAIPVVDLLMLLRGPLLVPEKEIRALALRVLRYTINTADDVRAFEAGCLAPFIVRIIDTNDGENSFEDRIQSFRLIRKLLSVSPHSLPSCLITSLIAIVKCSARPAEKSKNVPRDRLYRACIEILCEIAFELPRRVIRLGGLNALLEAILDNSISADNPAIAESMIIAVLHLLRHSPTRPEAHTSFLMSPFFAISPIADEAAPRNQYQAARLALGCMLLNWAGLGVLCASRSLSELLAVFCCNLEEDHLVQSLLGLFFDVFDLRIAHDVNTSDADHCFHGLVKGHEALASNGHDYGEFTLDKQFIIGECTAKWGGVNGADEHDPFDLTISYRTLLLAVLLDSRIVENLIMLITSTKSKLIAAQAGFLLAEIDALSAANLPTDFAATGELITAHLTKLINCAQDRVSSRRAAQAINWLKSYKQCRRQARAQMAQTSSIYLEYQLQLQQTHATWKKSTPNKQFNYHQHRRRSSVWATLGSMTKSFTENSLDQILSSSANVGGGGGALGDLHHSRDNVSNMAVTNKFCEFIVETFVHRGVDVDKDWVLWRWDLLPAKLECFDLLADIHLGEADNCPVHVDTNSFFRNLVAVFTRPASFERKVDWREPTNEDQATRQWVKTGLNLINLLARLFYYHVERGRKTHVAAERAKTYLLQIATHVMHRLEQLTQADLRHERGAKRSRFVPLLLGQLARVESAQLRLVGVDDWHNVGVWAKRDESGLLGKLLLSSFNLTRDSAARTFVASWLPKAKACGYFVELVQLWVNQRMSWIYEDTWCARQLLAVIATRTSTIDPVLEAALDVLRLLLANPNQRELLEIDDFVVAVMRIGSVVVRNRVLVVLSISEQLCRQMERQSDDSFETVLDALIEFWLSSGQYEFVAEVDARLRQAYTTSQVKHYKPGEPPPRRSHRHGPRAAVQLPVNLFRLMTRHPFGITKLSQRVIEPLKEHAAQRVVDDETLLDRRVNMWSLACVLSSDRGCRAFGAELMGLLTRNCSANRLSIKATVFYALSLVASCSLGAECVESAGGGGWRCRKGRRRRGDSTQFKQRASHSTESNDSGSREHLLASLDKLYDYFDQPLMVSILKQWSRDDISDIAQVPTNLLRDRFREQRSQSDTTAMELTILRHHQQTTPKKTLVPLATSTPPPSLKLSKLAPLPEYKRDSTDIELDSLEIESPSSLYIASSSFNFNAANNTPQKRKQKLSDSSRRQIDTTTMRLTSFPQVSTLASKLRKSFRGGVRAHIKKSLTTPEFIMNRSSGSGDSVFEDVESQNNNNGNTHGTSLNSDDSRHESAKQLERLTDYVGCALPGDVFGFLTVDYAEKETRHSSEWRDEEQHENVNGGETHLMRLAQTEQSENVENEEVEEDTSTSDVGTLEHVNEVHDQIVKAIAIVISGRESQRTKLLLFRRRWSHYFQSVELYNRVIRLLNEPDVSVGDRMFIHEMFDWRITDGTGGTGHRDNRLFFDEIEKLSMAIYERLTDT